MKKRAFSIVLALSLLGTALAGCGAPAGTTQAPQSNNASTAAQSSAAATTEKAETTAAPKAEAAQGVTDTEILVANTAATSGNYAPVGVPFTAGIEAYFKKINEGGGVNGRKIKFLHTDDEFDPAKGKAMLQSMVEDQKVFAIVGAFGTPDVAATLPDLKEYGIPTVYFATGIGQLYNEKATGPDRGIFPVQPIYITEGSIMVARGYGDFKAKKIGVIYTNDDAGKDMLKGAEAKAKELKIELVSEQVAAGATDVSAAVTAIKNANVDFIVGAAIQGTIGTIVKALAAQDVNKPVITTYVNVAPVIAKQVYEDIKGKFDLYGNGWVSFTQESAVKELGEYQKWIAADYATNAYAITGWIAASFFVEGVKRVGDKALTWENYMNAMEESPINNPFGGTIDYRNGLRAGTTVMNLSKVKDESGWEEVYPLEEVEQILKKNGG